MKKTLWPVILIIFGAMLLLNAILPFKLPIMQVLIALFCVWIGISMFTGGGKGRAQNDYTEDSVDEDNAETMSNIRFRGLCDVENRPNEREYNCVFSSSDIDLTAENTLPQKIEINCVFSASRIRLPVDYNISIHASGAFCSLTMPNGQSMILGENHYSFGSQDPMAPTLNVEINCAFGSLTCDLG